VIAKATFRKARRDDLEAIVAMFGDDELGRLREDVSLPLNRKYLAAFDTINADPNQYLLVAELDGDLAAYLQISFIAHLSRLGGLRGQVESVRVASHLRGRGLGGALMKQALSICRQRGCQIVQLTTDVSRKGVREFYERLGFSATHHGMKLFLTD